MRPSWVMQFPVYIKPLLWVIICLISSRVSRDNVSNKNFVVVTAASLNDALVVYFRKHPMITTLVLDALGLNYPDLELTRATFP